MKALVFLGIHSHISALEAVWERVRDSDVIHAAGDYVDYGQRVQIKVLIKPSSLLGKINSNGRNMITVL